MLCITEYNDCVLYCISNSVAYNECNTLFACKRLCSSAAGASRATPATSLAHSLVQQLPSGFTLARCIVAGVCGLPKDARLVRIILIAVKKLQIHVVPSSIMLCRVSPDFPCLPCFTNVVTLLHNNARRLAPGVTKCHEARQSSIFQAAS